MLAAVASEAPQLVPLSQWLYLKPGALVVPNAPPGSPIIQSSTGVRQGDPCGPLFFALTIQPILQRVQQIVPDVRMVAYLDDIVLQGKRHDVQRAYSDLRRQISEAGLYIQRDKSLIYSPHPQEADWLAHQLGI